MNIRQLAPILLFAIVAVGCESVQPVAANTPSIILKKAENRSRAFGSSVDFPAGVYAPDFQTDEGIYYMAPTKLIFNGMGIHRPQGGGLFVAHPKSSDQRQGAWVDGTSTVYSSTWTYRFDEPIRFEIQPTETK